MPCSLYLRTNRTIVFFHLKAVQHVMYKFVIEFIERMFAGWKLALVNGNAGCVFFSAMLLPSYSHESPNKAFWYVWALLNCYLPSTARYVYRCLGTGPPPTPHIRPRILDFFIFYFWCMEWGGGVNTVKGGSRPPSTCGYVLGKIQIFLVVRNCWKWPILLKILMP